MSFTIPSEHQEAVAFVGFLRKFGLRYMHCPNETGIGGRLGFKVAIRKKHEGMQKGFPDYLVFLKNEVVGIELKRRQAILKKGGLGASPSAISPEQKEWWVFLNTLPYCKSYIAFGAEQAIDIIQKRVKGITV